MVALTVVLSMGSGIRWLTSLRAAQRRVVIAATVAFVGTGVWVVKLDDAVITGRLGISELFQIFCMALSAVLLFWVLATHRGIPSNWRTGCAWLLAYSFACLLSTVVSPAPLLTIYKSLLVGLDVLLIAAGTSVFFRKGDAFVLADLVYWLFALICIGAAAGALMLPQEALKPISGVIGVQLYGMLPYVNPNELGFVCAVVAVLSIVKWGATTEWRRQWLHLSMASLSLVGLFLCQARTSIIAWCVAMAFVASTIKQQRIPLALVLLTLIGFGAKFWLSGTESSAVQLSEAYLQRGLSEEQLRSFTGRTELWKSGWDMVMDSPFIGTGFEAGARLGGERYGVAVGSHLHNSHIQVLANTGFLGYLLWLGMIAAVAVLMIKRTFSLRFPVQHPDDRMHIGMVAAFGVALIRTFTGSVLLSHSFSMLMLIAIMVYLGAPSRVQSNLPRPIKRYAAVLD